MKPLQKKLQIEVWLIVHLCHCNLSRIHLNLQLISAKGKAGQCGPLQTMELKAILISTWAFSPDPVRGYSAVQTKR